MTPFSSQRAPVYAAGGMACSSHPLAAFVGAEVLHAGGNAADAAMAMAAMVNVGEPMMNGLGGDTFIMVYWQGALMGINGSGCSSALCTREWVDRLPPGGLPQAGGGAVTAPGALDGYLALYERFGSRPLSQLVAPAVAYARAGIPVGEKVSRAWRWGASKLQEFGSGAEAWLVGGQRAPYAGESFRQRELAHTWERVGLEGRSALYEGDIAEKVVRTVSEHGGVLTREDLRQPHAIWVEPLCVPWGDRILCEMPPNGQGLIVPMALGILEHFDLKKMLLEEDPLVDHLIIEAMKLAFADAEAAIGDPRNDAIPVDRLLSPEYLAGRAKEIDLTQAHHRVLPGRIFGDTTYFTVVDQERNAVSLITSISDVFGSGLVVPGTGIILHNRGADFVREPGHPNSIGPSRRVRHTILPAMVLQPSGELELSFGCMGANMQPQGQVQILLRHYLQGLNLQQAIDAPRVRMLDGRRVSVEVGHHPEIKGFLAALGHEVIGSEEAPREWKEKHDFMRTFEGSAQAISLLHQGAVLCGASDPRLDGTAVGF